MNSISQIEKSVSIIRKHKVPYALLHCTNVYPTPYNLVRLNCLKQLSTTFKDAVIGLSDHTVTNHTCFAAVALGAKILERHFVDNKSRKGPDVICSMTPNELNDLILGSKNIHSALKGKNKNITKEEKITARFAFGSVVATKYIRKGEKLTKKNIFTRRPGTGFFSATDYQKILGKKAKKNINLNSQLKRGDI